MRKRTSRSERPPGSIQGVSMQMLDKELSRHVEIARTQPVSVDRYGVPWVWIVSHPLWMQADHLKSLVPQDHALVHLREAIDSTLAHESALMNALSAQSLCGLDARRLTRAWMLQVVYSLPDPRRVREGLVYNMLWRWFVGYQLRSEPLPELEPFVQDVNRLSAHPQVVELAHRSLGHSALLQADTHEFRINHGLLHALRARTAEWSARLPEPLPAGLNTDREGRAMAR